MYKKSKIKINRGALYAFFSTLFAVIAFHFIKLSLNDFSETAAASFGLMGVGLLSFGLLGFKPKKIKTEIKTNLKPLLLAGLLFAAFEFFLFLALHTGEISKVIPVTQSSLIFAILAEILFLHEKKHLPQKIIGTLVVTIGIVLMYLF